MSSKLFDNRYQTKDTYTENGMPTNSSSGSWVVDLFFKMGASRNTSEGSLESLLMNAWAEDPALTIKAVFYNRDIRGGQGERRSFRIFLKWLAYNQLEVLLKNINLVPEYGRWDDLFGLLGIQPQLDEAIHGLIWYNLVTKPNKLLAKWMPRENKKGHDYAIHFMKVYGLSPEQYRQLLVRNTEVVETLMCQKRWEDIKYAQVPSVAMNKYRKAFSKQDATRFTAWIQDVKSGKSKVNASAIFPHDIVRKVYGGYGREDADAVQIQWDALPNYLEPGKQVLPICDVSGSMSGDPMLICIALGIYLAERNVGIFQNEFITFSDRPTFTVLKGKNLYEKVNQLSRADWNGSTDIEKVFNTILFRANGAKLNAEDMPDTILILSDMQFNQCIQNASDSALEMMRKKYETAGYKMPNIVFWNLRDSTGVPAKVTESGVALVSGFSPSIMKQVLSDDLSPMGVLVKTLMSERYAPVTL